LATYLPCRDAIVLTAGVLTTILIDIVVVAEAYDAECAALARALEAASLKGPRSSRTPRPPSGVVSEESGPARCTRSRQESTSRCYGGPDRISPSKSGGVRRTRGSQETSLLRRCMASESISKRWDKEDDDSKDSEDSEDSEGRAAAGRSGVTR